MASFFQRPVFQIALITAGFAGGYYALRTIPATNCNFLHYDTPLVTADGLQYCGTGTAFFVDLDKLPFPVTVKLTPDHPPAQGVETHYTLTLVPDSDPNNEEAEFRPSQLAESQTRKLHLLVVDSSLEDYQHIHPEPVGDTGDWTFSFTPRSAGPYHVYAQFIPTLSMREIIAETNLTIAGQAEPAAHRGLAPFTDDGYVYTLATSATPVVAGSNFTITLAIRRADGAKVELQPIMGGLAHLVAFDPTRNGVAHLHPTYTGHESDPAPSLAFQINLGQPGRYRLWAQVKIGNRERYIPFDLDVTR